MKLANLMVGDIRQSVVGAVILFLAMSSALFAAEFKGNPYLCTPNWTEATGGEVTVCWVSSEDMTGEVTYGSAGQSTTTVKPQGSNKITQGDYTGSCRMWVRLTGLKAGAAYSYKVSGNKITGEKTGEINVPKKEDPILIVSFGDWGVGNKTKMPTTAQIDFIESRAGKKVDLFVDVGDTRQHRGLYQFTNPAQLSRIPICLALGNHEGDSPEVALPWEFFYLPSGVPNHNGFFTVRWGSAWLVFYPWAQSVEKQYYGFSGGNRNMHYTELAWLKNTISQAPADAPWRCLVQHQPIFHVGIGGGGGHSGKGEIALPEEIIPTLRQYNVSFVFSGHAHNFLRTYPIADKDGNLPAGFVRDPNVAFDAAKGTTQLITAGSINPHQGDIPLWEAFFSNASGPVYVLFGKTGGQGEFINEKDLNLLHKFTFTGGGASKP